MYKHLKQYIIPTALMLLFSLFFSTCQTTIDNASKTEDLLFNQEITSEEGELLLVGRLNREAWKKDSFQIWFASEYQSYEVDDSTLSGIKTSIDSLEILVFMGTWCSDSRQEVPRFYKILESLEFDENRLQVVALDNHPDRRKQSPQHEEVGWDIEYVPTFIFLDGGKEIGRIVETPEISLEKDLSRIAAKKSG